MRVIITTAAHGVLWEGSLENGSVTISKEDSALLQSIIDTKSDMVIHVIPGRETLYDDSTTLG